MTEPEESFRGRIETMTVLSLMLLLWLAAPAGLILFFYLLYSKFWWVAILYGLFYVWDVETPHNGSRRSEWFRNLPYFKYYASYFPITLKKTAELDPTKNYILATYPHGVITLSALGYAASNGVDFSKMFAGMKTMMVTIGFHLMVPFAREYMLLMGVVSPNVETLLRVLDPQKYKGRCLSLSVGGVKECAIPQKPDETAIVLKSRKGFIRVAFKTGAGIVPVFGFGENDLFKVNETKGWHKNFQDTVAKYTGLYLVDYTGRGIFKQSSGIIPFKKPVTVVFGAPIEVERNIDPTPEEVDAVHAEFVRRLQELFDTHKHKYLENPEGARLVIQ